MKVEIFKKSFKIISKKRIETIKLTVPYFHLFDTFKKLWFYLDVHFLFLYAFYVFSLIKISFSFLLKDFILHSSFDAVLRLKPEAT